MCENNKRRNVELDVTYELVSVYDPEYFELKQKYEELCKVILGYVDGDMPTRPIESLATAMCKLIELAKGDKE